MIQVSSLQSQSQSQAKTQNDGRQRKSKSTQFSLMERIFMCSHLRQKLVHFSNSVKSGLLFEIMSLGLGNLVHIKRSSERTHETQVWLEECHHGWVAMTAPYWLVLMDMERHGPKPRPQNTLFSCCCRSASLKVINHNAITTMIHLSFLISSLAI